MAAVMATESDCAFSKWIYCRYLQEQHNSQVPSPVARPNVYSRISVVSLGKVTKK